MQEVSLPEPALSFLEEQTIHCTMNGETRWEVGVLKASVMVAKGGVCLEVAQFESCPLVKTRMVEWGLMKVLADSWIFS